MAPLDLLRLQLLEEYDGEEEEELVITSCISQIYFPASVNEEGVSIIIQEIRS